MSPDFPAMSAQTFKIETPLKCKDDGTNWPRYKEVTLQKIKKTAGLARHLRGSPRPPHPVYNRDENAPATATATSTSVPTPLTDEEREALEDKLDEWEQREAAMRDIIYTTVSPSTMTEIKGGKTAKDVWDALVSKFE
ncbi:uncharacterized protein SCHCODRAFT_01050936, partial [Schizophyllum commune H4-8]|uniref:uncharacterized protein n=1 Tax=Schizophyllum commune (strain H4-8 / FGSC 9210) TaxID=578458 RepID=UPI00215F35C3